MAQLQPQSCILHHNLRVRRCSDAISHMPTSDFPPCLSPAKPKIFPHLVFWTLHVQVICHTFEWTTTFKKMFWKVVTVAGIAIGGTNR